MGKRLRQQRRGKGSNLYTKHPGTFNISVKYDDIKDMYGEVVALRNSTGYTAPIMTILYEDFSRSDMIAPEGITVGSKLYVGSKPMFALGSVIPLSMIPDGTPIYNIEAKPGDGGKYVRTAGAVAKVAGKTDTYVSVILPSKRTVNISPECRAQLGIVAGGGMDSLPIMKAGKSHYMYHAINRTWPRNRGVKMNPVDHPFGGKQHHKGKSSSTSRNAPPGRKVGHIASRRTGRRKR
ncbi:MAG: 50S ribosomal protein L2 [Candidatus Marsarchaeota archaeon]|jgi:large subunit ribosomal protein L2|nr:50S ribosomal protein L2 [Candidatus Marsarchaeota archaeon]